MHLELTSGHLSKTATAHLAKCGGTCCDDVTAVTVTLTNWAGCFAHMNGTYVLGQLGCVWSIEESDTGPASPCSASGDLCQTTSAGGITYYWYNLAKVRGIYVTLDNDSTSPFIDVRVDCRIWAYRLSGGLCTDRGSAYGETNDWTRATCDSGAATYAALAYRDTTGGLTNYTVGDVSLALSV